MTDCFFVSVREQQLPTALQKLEDAIRISIANYKDKVYSVNRNWVPEAVDILVQFEIQSYTILPEMLPVQGGLLAAGTQQQFTTLYTLIALVIVNDTTKTK